MEINQISNIGSKIRKERRSRGFSQSELSKKLDISPSYLNLLESGRRTITVPLLIKVGNELGLSLKDLTLESNQRALSDVMDVLSNEMFEDLDITNQETAEFISSNPNIAKALLTLNDAHKSFKEDMQNRLEKMEINTEAIEKPTRLPVEIVSDILQENKITNPSIEDISRFVIKIRSHKLPNPRLVGNCGSFFKNPIVKKSDISCSFFKSDNLITWEVDKTYVKVGAARLIELVKDKIIPSDNVSIYKNHSLVLVTNGRATQNEVLAFASQIQELILKFFNINLEIEPTVIK